MRRRAHSLLLLTVVLAVAPALAAPPPQGVLYVSSDKLLSIRFPGKPTETERDVPNQGSKVHVQTATLLAGEHGYTVTTNIYPLPTGPGAPAAAPVAPGTPLSPAQLAAIETVIGQTVDNTMSTIKGHVVARRAITLDGLQGSEVQFEAIDSHRQTLRGIGRVVVSPIPLTTYVAIALQFDGKPDPAARRFLDSLHLGKKVEVQP